MNANSRESFTFVRVFLYVALVAVLLFLAGKVWRGLEDRSLAVADQLGLGGACDRGLEAGRPLGENLLGFMHGRRSDFVVSNRVLTIAGTKFLTQFALTQSMSGLAGTLFVTTNRVLIWLD